MLFEKKKDWMINMKLHIAPRIHARRLLRLLFAYCSLIERRHVPRACLSLGTFSQRTCYCSQILCSHVGSCVCERRFRATRPLGGETIRVATASGVLTSGSFYRLPAVAFTGLSGSVYAAPYISCRPPTRLVYARRDWDSGTTSPP